MNFNYNYKDKTITVFYDKNSNLFAVLVDRVYNSKFVNEVLKNFDEFEVYNNWELNIKIADFLEENLPIYF